MKVRICFAVLSLIALSGATTAQTAISSTMNLGVFADANQNDGSSSTDTYVASQSGTLNPFGASLSVTNSDLLSVGVVTVTSTASSTFSNAASGAVAWRNMGWNINATASSGSKLNSFVLLHQPVWEYKFIATSSGQFAMNYDVRATGNHFGLQGVLIEWTGTGGGLDLRDPFTPVANGTFLREIVAGSTYTISLLNYGNLFTAPNYQSAGSMDADFNWNINAVPEPASMAALALFGVPLLRRRR